MKYTKILRYEMNMKYCSTLLRIIDLYSCKGHDKELAKVIGQRQPRVCSPLMMRNDNIGLTFARDSLCNSKLFAEPV